MQVETYIAAIFDGSKVVLIPTPSEAIPIYTKTSVTRSIAKMKRYLENYSTPITKLNSKNLSIPTIKEIQKDFETNYPEIADWYAMINAEVVCKRNK